MSGRAISFGLSGMLVCAVGVVGLGMLSRGLPVASELDVRVLAGLAVLEDPAQEDEIASLAAHVTDPLIFVLLLVALAAYGVAHSRHLRTVSALVLALGSVLTTQVVQVLWPVGSEVLADGFPEPTSFPSGHATAAMALSVGAVLLSPASRRTAVAFGGGFFAFGQALGMLSQSWHRPSDVLAGHLVVATWASMVLAAILWRRRRQSPRRSEPPAPQTASVGLGRALACGGIVVFAAFAAVLGLSGVISYAWHHPLGAFGAMCLTLSAIAVPLCVAAVLPGLPPRVR
jgi:membrane-associated phospholipid phosphatase